AGGHDVAAGRGAGAAAASDLAPSVGGRPVAAVRGHDTGAARDRGAGAMTAPMLDLTPGAALVLDGVEWTVESFAAHYGRVVLRRDGADDLQISVRALLHNPDCRP